MIEPTSPVQEEELEYPIARDLVPSRELEEGRYAVRYARTAAELDELLRLRFQVFNIELNEGLEESLATGRDRDEFDAVCHHLIVVDRRTDAIVGTYRIQTAGMAAANRGFYSAAEFDLGGFPSFVTDSAVEVGRACVALEHRNTQVLFLLWRGLALYMAANQLRFLFGCCSLTSQDAAEGLVTHRYLQEHGHLHPEIVIAPQPEYACLDADAIAALDTADTAGIKLPQLFRIYLRHGAKACGLPAIDRRFKTIDWLVLFDVAAMDEKKLKTFFQ
jgi:putative hemolysin